MDDYLACWDLDSLRVLHEHAAVFDAPAVGDRSLTICFWFRAKTLTGTQVIANQGCMNDDQPGWTIFLKDKRLCFRVCAADSSPAEITAPLSAPERWQYFAGVIDRQAGRLYGYLNGDDSLWQVGPQGAVVPKTAGDSDADVIIGGYTDPAGGHFDHTFGRNGSGLVDDFRMYARALSPPEIASFVAVNNPPPFARFRASVTSGPAPITVQFDATPSYAQDGHIRFYLWDFGDGSTGYGPTPTHHYPYRGQYRVHLTVIDDRHLQASAVQMLTWRGKENPLRFIPVFVNGEEGYACYRIPSIVRTANGALLVFAEGRVQSCSDSSRPIRIVCKRSPDNGATWTPVQIVSQNIIEGIEYVAQNCSVVVDMALGTGRVIALYNKAEHSEWDLAAGLGVSRIHAIFSDDHGVTWHGETDITPAVHKPYNPDYVDVYRTAALRENQKANWRIQRPTLGHAIQLMHEKTRGRLFFAGTFTQGERSVFDSQNYAFWTDDLGKTWKIGGVNPRVGLNEAIAVELESGRVMINSRGYCNKEALGHRAVTIGTFDPTTDQLTFGDTYLDPALVDPAVQASIIRYTRSHEAQFGSKSRIVFSNPDHLRARRNMTVRLSYDEGITWPVKKTVDPGPSSYSDLVIQDDMRIGLLYERGNQGGIFYVNFTLNRLTDGDDVV